MGHSRNCPAARITKRTANENHPAYEQQTSRDARYLCPITSRAVHVCTRDAQTLIPCLPSPGVAPPEDPEREVADTAGKSMADVKPQMVTSSRGLPSPELLLGSADACVLCACPVGRRACRGQLEEAA